MERIPTELLYLLVFFAIIVLNVIARQAARRRQQQEQAEQPTVPAPVPAEDAPLEDIWGRSPAPAPMPVAEVRTAPPPAAAQPQRPRRIHPVRDLLKGRRDLRRAVVLMMVLGPCRAQEPPER
jgi:hypothetical protein